MKTLFVCLMAVLISSPSMVRAEDITFPPEAFEGWQRLIKNIDNVSGQFEFRQSKSIEIGESSSTVEKLEFGIWHKDGCFVSVSNSIATTVFGANRNEVFRAERAKNQPKFELTFHADGQRGGAGRANYEVFRDRLQAWYGRFLFSATTLDQISISELVQNRYFATLESLSVDDEKGIAVLTFDAKTAAFPASNPKIHDDPSNSIWHSVVGGTIYFRTKNDWAIDRYRMKTTWGSVEGAIEYEAFGDSWAPHSISQVLYLDDGRVFRRNNYQMLSLVKSTHDDSKSTLDHYGISRQAD